MNKVSRANFCKASAGTVMVEFAVILPLLLLILFGITELGRALYQQNMLTQAVEFGGRYMARIEGAVDAGCNPVGDPTTGRWATIAAEAKDLIRCGDGTITCVAPIVPNLVSGNILINVGPPISSSIPGCVITVKATANFQSIFGGDLIAVPNYQLGPVTLNAETQERYIGL
jgi:hypothetical protein